MNTKWFRNVSRLTIVAATLCFGFSGVDAPLASCAVAAQPDTEPVAASQDLHARDTILALVRAHRPTADDLWRRTLADAIYTESVAADVDPLLVASIIATEASFQSRIVSRAGAVGLMQLRPFVAEAVARSHDIEWNGVDTLYVPKLNVRLGLLYYKELMRRFDGDEHMALTAYLYGPTRVSRQVRSGTYVGSAYALRVIGRYHRLSASSRDDPGRARADLVLLVSNQRNVTSR